MSQFSVYFIYHSFGEVGGVSLSSSVEVENRFGILESEVIPAKFKEKGI